MPLIVYSRSTEDFAKNMDGDFLKISGPPTKETLKFTAYDEIIAIGGGSVIDTAKIIARNSKRKKVIAIPTTASGAAKTSHAAYWQGGRKYSIETPRAEVRIDTRLLKTLPDNVIRSTSYDALSQALESYWSKKATFVSRIFARRAIGIIIDQIENNYPNIEKLIKGGNLSGRAIEITGTNITHAISYPMTAFFNIPHGLAVGLVLLAVAKYIECKITVSMLLYKINLNKKLDIELIANEAMTYPQIHNAKKDITKEQVMNILEESL